MSLISIYIKARKVQDAYLNSTACHHSTTVVTKAVMRGTAAGDVPGRIVRIADSKHTGKVKRSMCCRAKSGHTTAQQGTTRDGPDVSVTKWLRSPCANEAMLFDSGARERQAEDSDKQSDHRINTAPPFSSILIDQLSMIERNGKVANASVLHRKPCA